MPLSKKRTPVPRFPKSLEARYRTYLLGLVDAIRELYDMTLVQHSTLLWSGSPSNRLDGADDIEQQLALLESRTDRLVRERDVRIVLENMATAGEVFVADQVQRQLSVFGLSIQRDRAIAALSKVWVAENVDLVVDVADSTRRNIARAVRSGFAAGLRWEEVARDIQASDGVLGKARNRAQLIARDQIGKMNGNLTRELQSQAGIRLYRWMSADDSRVRALHRANDDKVFSWSGEIEVDGVSYSEAPRGEQPGVPVNCRCVAQAVAEE